MMNALMRLNDKTLIIFALIASVIASGMAIVSVLDRSDDARALATLDRPLPVVKSMETSEILARLETLGLFEDIIRYEQEAESGEASTDGLAPIDPGALPKPSAIVMQEDGITAFAFRDGVVMRFQEGDIVSGRTVVALTLSEIVFRGEDGQEETIVLFGGNGEGSGEADL